MALTINYGQVENHDLDGFDHMPIEAYAFRINKSIQLLSSIIYEKNTNTRLVAINLCMNFRREIRTRDTLSLVCDCILLKELYADIFVRFLSNSVSSASSTIKVVPFDSQSRRPTLFSARELDLLENLDATIQINL